MKKGPLDGVTILEMSVMVMAPIAGRLLSDLGARVIKVEREAGDGWRVAAYQHLPERFSLEENPIFDAFNSGKEMISMDLRTDEGKKLFDELLDKVDIFMTNMKLSSLKKMGIHYEDVMPKHPKLIYALGLGFGEKGPDKDTPAYDTTAFWARSGFLLDLAVIGPKGEYMPSEAPSSMGDTFTGTTLAMEICAALYQRDRTGKGDVVRSSLYHNAVFCMQIMMLQSQKPYGRNYPLTRIQHGNVYRSFRCKDGEYIYPARGILEDTLMKQLKMFGLDKEITDPDWLQASNHHHDQELYDLIASKYMEKTADEWMELSRPYGIAMTKMGHFYQLAEDEQAWANDYVEKISYDNGHTDIVATTAIEMDSCIKEPIQRAHEIGQDTDDVLKSFGYSEQEIASFKEKGIVKQMGD